MIIFATVAFGRERSSSVGGRPEWPSRSDMAGRADEMTERTVLPFLLFFTSPRVQFHTTIMASTTVRILYPLLNYSSYFLLSSVGRTG